MGRPERPLNPDAGPVQRFAHELRELRRAAGGPSYRVMAVAAGFSATTLAQAAAGERLPSLAVVQGYVRACGGDPGEWEACWKEAEVEAAGVLVRDQGEAGAPYRGLARYEPGDRALFFGRDRLVDELRHLVCEHRFAVVFGASGSGKSSLLRAGLIPSLREEIADRSRAAVLRVFTPGARPARTYGHLLAPAEGEPESWVVVDQFEEVFTLCRDGAERARFLDLLLAARDPESRLRVLIAVRADFYARCTEHRELADALVRAALLVGPMTAGELRETVVKPAQAAGLLVERELTARIVEEVLDQPSALPMLSHALLETWRRRKGRLLTLAAYEAAGGVRGAIAASAEQVHGQLTPDQARTARLLLLRLVEPGQGTPDTRRALSRTDLEEWADRNVPEVVERLARARLLTVDEEAVHLAHEALISCWPRLHGWVEESRERLRHHRWLTEAARVWLEHDCDPGALYRGSRLVRAQELFPDHVGDPALTVAERSFLAAGFEAREAERRAASLSRRRARVVVSALSALLATALVAGLVAWQQHQDNARQHTANAARRIAAVADGLRTTDPRAALLLGVAAWRMAPLPETRRALLGSLAQPEPDAFTDPAPGYASRRFLVDSGRVLLSVDDGTWRTWDVTTRRRTGVGRLPKGEVRAVGPDGRLLAVAVDGGTRLWDTAAGRWTGVPRAPDRHDLDVGPSGRSYLLGGSGPDGVRLRSVADDRLLFEAKGVDRADVAPSADDRLVAVCPDGGTPQVWDTATHRALPGAWQKAGGGLCDEGASLTVLGGGTGRGDGRFAVATPEGVRIWDIGSGRQVADLADPGVRYASFSGDGSFMATACADEVRIWRLSDTPSLVFRHPLANQHVHGGLAWDPGTPVLRYLEGGTVHTLDLTTTVTAAWRDRPLDAVLVSPDGRTFATAELSPLRGPGRAYGFALRATDDGRLIRALPAPPVSPDSGLPLMSYSPDGRSLVYGLSSTGRRGGPQRFTVWNVTGDRARGAVDLSTGTAVVGVALSPGGRTLYATRRPAAGELRNEAWDTVSGRREGVAAGSRPAGTPLLVRPDGRLIVGDNRVAGLPDGPGTARDLVQGERISALAFSIDGRVLAASDRTGRVALWDGGLRHRAGILRNLFPSSFAGSAPEEVSALALSPDGRTLAVGGDTGTLQLWDTLTQQPLGGRLPTPGEAVASLAFSADSSTLYAGGAHVPLHRYTVDPERAVDQICARARSSNLTRAQWRTYVPEVAYRKVCGA
ncbi:nSTAND1 domain-containing NTPase [Streptomyces koelreuteriae]|uniref:nSTAND1 domain-containing NTPase n=1 Tax=Streptomyces koelreuteriae TaxID=2838015 RepID=UPI003EBFF759